jgi:hypothetical protein
MTRQDLHTRLAPFMLDGSEAVQAIVLMLQSFSRPPDLRRALHGILKKHYSSTVPLDTVVDLLADDEGVS